MISSRLRDTTRQLLEARFLPAEQRLYRCLERLAGQFDDSPDGFIPLTQADVASMSGTTRSTANRVLRQAEADGVIDIGRSRIRVADLGALRRRVVEIWTTRLQSTESRIDRDSGGTASPV